MKAFYFPHDDNAAGDERVLKLRAKFGNTEGYAMWFMLLEYLSRNKGYMDSSPIAELSICYGIPSEKWQEFITFCIEIGLLKKSAAGIFSYRIVEHAGYRKERAESGRKGAKTRWSSPKVPNSCAIAEPLTEPMAGEERRGENKKSLKKATEPTNEPTTKKQKPEGEQVTAFFEMAETAGWCEHTYTEAKTKQFYELSKNDREDVLRKMRVSCNSFSSSSASTKNLAKKIFHETVGLIQDRALDKSTLTAKSIESRRAFADDLATSDDSDF